MRKSILFFLLLASAFQTVVGDKFKAVMVAYILFVSGLYADDANARMERNKTDNKTASELTTEAPKTVRAVQQSSVVKRAEEYDAGDLFLDFLRFAMQKNPQLTSEMTKVGQEYQKEDGAKPADLFKAPETNKEPGTNKEPKTNSVSNHNHSK
jgi:hypothetical protein